MRLKAVTKSLQKVISIQDDSSVSDLLKTLQSDDIISDVDIIIKTGFPPKAIDLSNDKENLLDLGIRAGDKLTIEEVGSSSGSVQESTPTTSSSSRSTTSSSSTRQKIELARNTKEISPDQTQIPLPEQGGSIRLHKVDDDNSCLFNSVGYLTQSSINLREIIAQYILSDPINYNDAILGKPVDQYTEWILKKTSWGGAIELQILGQFLGITINSIDVENDRVDSFNPDADDYIVMLFTGIHYDGVVFQNHEGRETRIFNKSTELGRVALDGAKQLAQGLNHKGYVTNTNTFQVKCKTCGAILDGEKKVTEHATKVKHFDFGEV